MWLILRDSVRQLSEKLLEAIDLCKQQNKKNVSTHRSKIFFTSCYEKELKKKFEAQLAELDENRAKLKDKCDRLQQQMDDGRKSLQSAEVNQSISAIHHIFYDI